MSHMTNKKRAERDRNALKRGFNGFNTGTRDMGKIKRQVLDDVKCKEMRKAAQEC